MKKMTKNNGLMSGKGEPAEWITVNGTHIPIADGESKEQAVERFTAEQEQEEREKALSALVQTLQLVSKAKVKELAQYIKSLEPIEMTANDKEIIAQFDGFSARKNVYTKGKSSQDGFVYKLSNIDKLPSIIKNSIYDTTREESGKNSPAHKGVKEWHYFINQIDTDMGRFDIVVNIRDKGNEQFVYEVAIRKAKK